MKNGIELEGKDRIGKSEKFWEMELVWNFKMKSESKIWILNRV